MEKNPSHELPWLQGPLPPFHRPYLGAIPALHAAALPQRQAALPLLFESSISPRRAKRSTQPRGTARGRTEVTAPAGSRDKEVSLSLSLPGCAQHLPGEGRARQQGHTCCWTERCDQGNRGPRRSSEQSAPQGRSAKGRRGDSGSLGEEGLDKSKGGSESWERCENTNLLQNTVLASPPRLLGTCGAHSSPAAPGTWHPAHGSADSAPPTARGTGSGNGAGCVRSCRRAITGKSRRQRARAVG